MQIDDAEKINDSKATYDLQNPSTSNAANQAWPSMGPHPDIHEAQTKQVLVDLNTKQGKNEEATKQRMWQQLLQPEQQQSDATVRYIHLQRAYVCNFAIYLFFSDKNDFLLYIY